MKRMVGGGRTNWGEFLVLRAWFLVAVNIRRRSHPSGSLPSRAGGRFSKRSFGDKCVPKLELGNERASRQWAQKGCGVVDCCLGIPAAWGPFFFRGKRIFW